MSKLHKIAESNGKQKSHVVFVHGLGGHYKHTWMADTAKPETFWPEWVPEKIEGATIWSLEYSAAPVFWFGSAMTLINRAKNVLPLLASDKELNNDKPVVFICHSLGGLVVKQLLREAVNRNESHTSSARLVNNVVSVVFYATPHAGSKWANLLQCFKYFGLSSKAVANLVKNDHYLTELYDWFKVWSTHIKQYVLVEQEAIAKFVKLVSETSANPNIAGVYTIPVDANHWTICKPENRLDSERYVHVIEFVEKVLVYRDVQLPIRETAKEVIMNFKDKKVRTAFVEFVTELIQEQKITIQKLEEKTGYSASCIQNYLDPDRAKNLDGMSFVNPEAFFNTVQTTLENLHLDFRNYYKKHESSQSSNNIGQVNITGGNFKNTVVSTNEVHFHQDKGD